MIYVNRNIWLFKRLKKATLFLSPRKMLTSTKIKEVISHISNFEKINIVEDKQLNFPLRSEKKV